MQLHGKSPGAHSNPVVAPDLLLYQNSEASTGSVNEYLLALGKLSWVLCPGSDFPGPW